MPRVLGMYSCAPLFSAYFRSLGVPAAGLVYSDVTSAELYRSGSSRGSIDPCYPSKVAVAHVQNLLAVQHRRAPLDCIFFPMFDVLDSPLVGTRGQNACPTVAATPRTVRAAFTKESDAFAAAGVEYLDPLINVANRRRARAVLDRLEREDRLGIVVLGRPYHHDPGLNHGIPEELRKRGYPVFSQMACPSMRTCSSGCSATRCARERSPTRSTSRTCGSTRRQRTRTRSCGRRSSSRVTRTSWRSSSPVSSVASTRPCTRSSRRSSKPLAARTSPSRTSTRTAPPARSSSAWKRSTTSCSATARHPQAPGVRCAASRNSSPDTPPPSRTRHRPLPTISAPPPSNQVLRRHTVWQGSPEGDRWP
ncbi:MAG: hypothetical protein H0X67_08945 [Acidobacteria bacterium]|nr:hypothetical protein [Acidobacteriota bacterium]